jgi:hypothetical protein
MTEIHSKECMARQAREEVETCKRSHVDRVVGCWVCDEKSAGR